MHQPNIKNTMNYNGNGAKVVIYGPAKIGKTRLSLTWPNCIVFNTERGLLSLRGTNVPYIDIEGIDSLYKNTQWLQSPQCKYQNIIFDSTSDLGEVVLWDHKQAQRDPRKAYGNTHDDVMGCWRMLRDLPNKNVVFIAKESWVKNGAQDVVRPSMPDKYLTDQLPYMFDGIFHMGFSPYVDGNGARIIGLRCQADFQTIAGDRSGRLAEWEEPNLDRLFHKILKG